MELEERREEVRTMQLRKDQWELVVLALYEYSGDPETFHKLQPIIVEIMLEILKMSRQCREEVSLK